MNITVGGLVVDELGNVLLLKRGRAWAPPGGPLHAGQLPDSATVDLIEEATGLKTLPVRLVGLYYESQGAIDCLHFQFRCLVRGGTLAPGDDIVAAHYFPASDLPAPLSDRQKNRLADGLGHTGGPPLWRAEQRAAWRRFIGRLGRPTETDADIEIDVIALLPDAVGAVAWVEYDGRYRLPITRPSTGEPPWAAAARAARQQTGLDRPPVDLAAVFAGEEGGLMLVFLAATNGHSAGPRFLPGTEPEGAYRQHSNVAALALRPGPTSFTHLPPHEA